MYPEEFHVDIDYNPRFDDDEYLKKYDIIHYHRTFGPYEKMAETNERLKRLGIVSIMDLDDYWSPGTHHPAYLLIKESGLDKKLVDNLKMAEYVSTTTPIFENEIKKLNKNTIVFPNAIDPNEKQYISNPEQSSRIRIGWLGGSCMTPDTEILTDNGWVRFDKLNKTEKVATLNPDTNELEYHKPTGYICEPFEGELNCAKTNLIEYEVTPNHNMYASEAKNLTHKKLNMGLILSEKIHGKNFHVKRDANWSGEEREYFILPSLEIYAQEEMELSYIDGLISKKSKLIDKMINKYGYDREIDMDDWLQFFGFWMAEGWVSKSKGLYQVGIAQSKDNNYLEIMFNLLVKMGFNPTYTKDRKQIRVFDRQLWEYLSQFGCAHEKFIPKDVLNLSPRQLKVFLEWFINGDGHIEKNKYQRTRAWTSSKSLADDLQEIALKIGIVATISNRGKKTTHIKGRAIKNQFDNYQVNFSKHPNISKHNKSNPIIKSFEQYNRYYCGNVYCVEVPNHIIYVRRNGKSMWIGNSHLRDLEILNGLVSKLKSEGLIDKVQFVLCGFDTRGTITTIDEQTKQQQVRKIKPIESVWYQYEKIFTDNYTTISPEYKEHLMKFTKDEYPNVENEPYRRVWTKPISTYATNYNLFDISLAPLEENIFNKVKSQLKVIEAGFHKKALITQNYGPYQIDLKDAFEFGGTINDTGNALLVDTVKNHKLWFQHIKRLIQNPELIAKLATNLHETVKDRYSIEAATKLRKEVYLKLLDNKNQ